MKKINKFIYIATLATTTFANISQDVNSNAEVLAWASEAAIASYTYNALSYTKQFENLKAKFTNEGWNNFEEALKKSGNLNEVINNGVVVSAFRSNPAEIESYSEKNSISTWVVKVPTQVTYENGYVKIEQDMETYLTISSNNDGKLLIQNINSSLVSPTRSANAIPKPRPNCKMANSKN